MSLYDVAAAYYHEHGNLNVPSEYVTSDGVLLGKWVARQRYAYLNPDRPAPGSPLSARPCWTS